MKRKDEKQELEKLLKNSPDNLNDNTPDQEEIPGLTSQPITTVDFTELREQCERDALIMLKNAIKLIIPEESLINNSLYLEDKLKVDVMSLSGMVYQLRTNEIMQKALIDQMNSGMVNARMFEVFSSMTKIIGELNKQLIQTVEALKETYKSFKNDLKEQMAESEVPQLPQSTSSDIPTVTRGTTELIENIRQVRQIELAQNEDVIPVIDLS